MSATIWPRRASCILAFSLALAFSAAAAQAGTIIVIGPPPPIPTIVIDFRYQTPGTVVTTLGEVGFGFSDSAVDLSVWSDSNGILWNALGASRGGSDRFQPGDVLSLGFAKPITWLEVTIGFRGSSGPVPFAAVSLNAAGKLDVSQAFWNPISHQSDRLVISSDTPFSTAELRAAPGSMSSFFVLKVAAVPEPGEGSLLLAAAALLAGRRASSGVTHG